MNKKKVGALCFAIACASAVVFTLQYVTKKQNSENTIMMENVEALSDPDASVNNTGPAKLKSCAGHAGTTKFCMCENSNPCTESACR